MKGFLLLEIIIACALSAIVTITLGSSMFQMQSFIGRSLVKIKTLDLSEKYLNETMVLLENDFDYSTSSTFETEGFSVNIRVVLIDNFTKEARVTVSRKYNVREVSSSLSGAVTDIRESEGQSSCRPVQDVALWSHPLVATFNLGSLSKDVHPTDIDLVGNYAYVSSDSAKASSSDLFIFDISDISSPIELSHLDTGPGINALHVAGDYAYLANDSMTSQLQIVEITDRTLPKLVASYRLPGIYGTSTPLGSAVFYKAGKVFLGSTKSAIEELHYIDVSSVKSPRHLAAFEMGNSVNDLLSFRERVYVASPHRDEVKIFDISSGSFKEVFSYNDPGATGTGKRLSLFLDTLFVGKTKTFRHNELFAFDLGSFSFPIRFKLPLSASVQGLIGYGTFLFVALHQATDGFSVFDLSLSSPIRLNADPIDFPGLPLNFDCDKDRFAVISEGSALVTFISPR